MQHTKYFGMTPIQIGILAGLAGLVCLLFGLAGWFILRGSSNGLSNASQSSLLPTPTPWTIPSPAPTQTATPIPYETLIPNGWAQFKTGLVEIWLPTNFQPGDPSLFNNSSHEGIAELILTDSPSESTSSQMLAFVSYEPMPAEPMDIYLDRQLASLPDDLRLAERRKVFLNSTEVARLVFEERVNNVEINHVNYVFQDGSTIWYVEYIAPLHRFYEMLSTFEKSAKTFRMVR